MVRTSQSYLLMALTCVEMDANPDGKRIVVATYRAESDIGMIDNIR